LSTFFVSLYYPSMNALTDQEVQEALAGLPAWQCVGEKIVRDFALGDFATAMGFVNRVARLAEEQNHHPDIDIRYNRVRLWLVTHDAGGITNLDIRLASLIDGLAAEVIGR
jgi:4a-hydroxytetrahydrobiopterin dehydratase